MAKYSFEFKKKIVQAYLNGEGGYEFLSNQYGVASSRDVGKWGRNYHNFGDKGLMRSRKNETYSFEYKLHNIVQEFKINNEVVAMYKFANYEYITVCVCYNTKLKRIMTIFPDGEQRMIGGD